MSEQESTDHKSSGDEIIESERGISCLRGECCRLHAACFRGCQKRLSFLGRQAS